MAFDDLGAIAPVEPRDRRGPAGRRRMTARARRGAGRRLGRCDGGRRDRHAPDRGGHNLTHDSHHLEAVVLERERANALAGRPEHGVQDRRRRHADRRLADAAQNPPDGMMIDSTFGICAIFIES